MRWKSWLCVLVLGWSVCAGAQTTVSVAPDAASREDVKKLFDVMASREQMAQMMHQLLAQMRAMSREQMKKKHPEISDAELARQDRESEDLIKNFPMDEMLDDMVPIYQRHFTKSDITALIAFYSSPAGQKFLHETPAVTAETMRAVFPRIEAEVDAAMRRAEQNADPPQK
ncbi:MAG TPA: DUF2059 domain-containing protein [Terriglobales bacterium]|nr:DUF2059 domain-containing protein [Terriglobales bacterium]